MLFLTGTFVLFTSRVLDSFDGMALFIATTESPLLYLIFQKLHYPKFIIDEFTLNLVHMDRKQDTYHYIVSS